MINVGSKFVNENENIEAVTKERLMNLMRPITGLIREIIAHGLKPF